MTASGMLVCQKCGRIKGRRHHRRRRRWGTRRRRRKGAGMRVGATAGVLVAAAVVVMVLVMPGGLDVLEGVTPSGDPLDSPQGDRHPDAESPPDGSPHLSEPPGGARVDGADAQGPPDGSSPHSPEPRRVIDLLPDTAWTSPPDPDWNMSSSAGSFEAQLVRLDGQGARPDMLKRVLSLDSPTELSFSFDNQSRVYSHFLLDTWYENRGLAELDKRSIAQGSGGPSLAGNTSRPPQPGGKIQYIRTDTPPRSSDVAESLAEAARGRSIPLDQLYNVALDAINDHRTAMGRAPVRLSDNVAAQIHAQDILEQRAMSHYMSNGEKPYMTHSMAGGAGYVAQNVAFSGYDRPWQCSSGHVICTKTNPAADIVDHHNGMMFDDAHVDWAHRYTILNPHHTHVSIGVAYTDYTLAFVQNFETRRIEGVGPVGSPANPISIDSTGQITVAGSMDEGLGIHSIGVYYDPLPSTRTYRIHVNDMSYGLGEPIAHIYEPHPHGYIPTDDAVIIMADRWNTSTGSVLIEFGAPAYMSKNGAYTFTVFLTDGAQEPFIGSSRTFMVGNPVDF